MGTTTPDYEALMRVMQSRRSCRAYDPAQPVANDVLDRCFEAARLAPSACNAQPWRFVVVREPSAREAICQQALLPGINHAWLREAPVIVALCAELNMVTHRVAPMVSGVHYYLIDAGIVGEHFVLAAETQGLGTCWIGWLREKAVKKILRIPRAVRVVSLIAVGHPKQRPDTLSGDRRKCLDDIRSRERWSAG